MTRKEQILNKALELINEKGFVHVGVREIARELKISPGNLSYHFGKKEDVLMALLERYREANTSLYETYLATPPSLKGFLHLMKSIFVSHYLYRGVFIGNQYVQAQLESGDHFNYQEIYERRLAGFARIFKELHTAGHLKLSEEDVRFLVFHMTLAGRFWIYEATLFDKSPDRDSTVKHYLWMLSKQLSLFATETGRQSIGAFTAELE